ncbi:hypothetical protein CLV51_10443 [Chitinophaga niastensis]|uniref:Uncharacterized protein n=1 Tax=Chitinophaga niastensis TaxID=536980 RepID=A0A2P8HGJ6_CHINA|nr:hypothetical protein [Chitinophaga niastensis]PSL45341.1 hypothetical protein CLV51_10443 [Chitinophaga niastensis]
MQNFFSAVLAIHIAGGTLSLITGMLAITTQKGGRHHRINGKLYCAGMTIIFITAIAMALIKELTFLLMVSFFSYHQLVRGYRALYLKKLHKGQRMTWVDVLINSIAAVFMICLLAWGLTGDWSLLRIVAIVFGLSGILVVTLDVRKFYVRPVEKQHWFYSHISGMGGAYIATITAFLVVNVRFLPGWIVWLGPLTVGLVIINITIARYKRKFKKVLQEAV